MKITSALNFTSLSLLAGLAAQLVSAYLGNGATLQPRRTTSILNQPVAQPALPLAAEAVSAASFDLNNIQSDVLVGMKKKKENFIFFSINNVIKFKSVLRKDISPLITTTHQVLSVDTQPITALNIAFSNSGLVTLGINDFLGDPLFVSGQALDATALGDPGTTNWVPEFVGTKIHGVFLLLSDTEANLATTLDNVKAVLGSSITVLHSIEGSARPGSEVGHEHFGYMDGISQPAISGFTTSPTPGQQVLQPGVFLLGESGDTVARPAWAKDGSFLAFRKLEQLVPEFNKFLANNPIVEPGVLTAEHGSELLGARMVGRWKSGAPVDLAPLHDDPALGADPLRNNDFTYAHPAEDLTSNQTRCPFSAHVRKTRPRADLSPMNTINHILRAGIPYGPEVSPSEAASGKTVQERGLAFVAYQSNIGQGFHFLQRTWANNPNFVFGKSDPTPGFDPIIGANGGAPRFVSGLDPKNSSRDITLLTDFVVSRGGEYFFLPSLSAIHNKLSV